MDLKDFNRHPAPLEERLAKNGEEETRFMAHPRLTHQRIYAPRQYQSSNTVQPHYFSQPPYCYDIGMDFKSLARRVRESRHEVFERMFRAIEHVQEGWNGPRKALAGCKSQACCGSTRRATSIRTGSSRRMVAPHTLHERCYPIGVIGSSPTICCFTSLCRASTFHEAIFSKIFIFEPR